MPTEYPSPPTAGVPLIRYTLWSSIFDIDRLVDVAETWEQLTQRMSTHARLARKDAAGGFGPYTLTPPTVRCYKHRDGQPRAHAHRCDECVSQQTLAVFDADIGDQDAMNACDERLAAAGVARHWYSSYSHGLRGRVAYRLLLPLDQPVPPTSWPDFRRSVIARYGIPADPRQCGGRSHFYYLPSCPSWATPVVRSGPGTPLRAADFTRRLRPAAVRRPLVAAAGFTPPDEPKEPVDLQPLRDELRKHAKTLRRNSALQYKADLLERLLDGKPLAQSGGRNTALAAATGMLAYRIPGQSVGTYRRLLEPSMNAMLDAGTRNTWGDVERLLLGAMHDKHEEELRDQEIADYLARVKEQVLRKAQSR